MPKKSKSRAPGKPGNAGKIGRPTLYRPEFCDLLVAHMGLGRSFESFGAGVLAQEPHKLRVNRSTLYDWEERHPAFADAKKRGEDASLLFHEELWRSGVSGQLRRIASETPVMHDGKPALDPEGRVLYHRTYAPATFAQAAWIFAMKNRFQWADRLSLTDGKGNALTITQLAAQVGDKEPEE